ncbi:MAG: phage holin family protein [Achromobacter sp.]|uniref:phage holin family protein n=1 Tax=Achromobacter sp. TaxID=134375 RepID=UPI003D033FD4
MSLIVAARFDTFDEAAEAARRLFAEGFTEDDIHTFYINTAGEHARFPIGGDRVADPDAKGGHFGAVAGASALGLVFALLGGLIAARLAASILLVIAAAGVGAYLGALAGALWVIGRGRRKRPGAPPAPDVHPDLRQAGVMLALHVSPERDALARTVLGAAGGQDIERANGRWLNGKWEDFDPLEPPRRAGAPSMAG